jgi:hypothetical protein
MHNNRLKAGVYLNRIQNFSYYPSLHHEHSQLMVFGGGGAVSSEGHMKHLNTVSGQKAELLNIATNGTHNYHWSLKDKERKALRILQYVYFVNTLHRVITFNKAVPWLRRLVAGLPPRRPGFNPEPVHVGFVLDKVALGQVFPCQVHYSEKRRKPIIFITGLYNEPQGCGASVASAAGPFTT